MPTFPSKSLSTSFTTNATSQAAQWLQAGYLLAYPTESVWGIGCDPFNPSAVQQLLAIKQRSVDKGLIVITDSAYRIEPLLSSLSAKQRQVVLNSWQVSFNANAQQAHTWLLPLNTSLIAPIPSLITGAHDSVAVRIIAHPLIQQLCAELVTVDNPYGFMVSTSCNPSGQPPALTLQQAQSYFISSSNAFSENVRYLLGETLAYQLPSQISDALTGEVIR